MTQARRARRREPQQPGRGDWPARGRVTVAVAAEALRCSPRRVRQLCDEEERFASARRDGPNGEWSIALCCLAAEAECAVCEWCGRRAA